MENRTYSSIYRIMHWAIALCMLTLLLTVFLRLTWLNKDHVADIIQNYMSGTDKPMTREEAITLAKQIRKPMWNWHLYLGYVLSGLFLIRLTLPLFGRMKFVNPFNKQLSAKTKFQYWVYIVFYIGVVTTLVTGLIMDFGPKTMKKPMETIHVLSLNYLIPFVILHLSGVLLAEFTEQPGIISRIVRGEKQQENG